MHNFVVNVLRHWPCRISTAERNFFSQEAPLQAWHKDTGNNDLRPTHV